MSQFNNIEHVNALRESARSAAEARKAAWSQMESTHGDDNVAFAVAYKKYCEAREKCEQIAEKWHNAMIEHSESRLRNI